MDLQANCLAALLGIKLSQGGAYTGNNLFHTNMRCLWRESGTVLPCETRASDGLGAAEPDTLPEHAAAREMAFSYGLEAARARKTGFLTAKERHVGPMPPVNGMAPKSTPYLPAIL